MSEVELDTLYNVNRKLYENVDFPTEMELDHQLASVGAWFSAIFEHNYFMLLCREKYDFTIFKVEHSYNEAIQELREVLESRGRIIEIVFSHDFDFYECWVKDEETDEISMYAFFPCDDWVIDVDK